MSKRKNTKEGMRGQETRNTQENISKQEAADVQGNLQKQETADALEDLQKQETADALEDLQNKEITDDQAESGNKEITDAGENLKEKEFLEAKEGIKKKENDWMEELKKQINDGIDAITGKKKADTPEGVTASKSSDDVPVPSKEQLQKELAESKGSFEHTPMTMTPDLERLLADELKEEKKNTKRSAQMLSVLAKHNFYANGLTPEELRTTLEDLGPTYVKIGQIMSSRTDLLPENYCKELEKLRQNVKELDPQIARAVIEAETGKKISEIYKEFRDDPIGSASIGQVHYGVLKDGMKVVTKVQRPLIAEMMAKDFELLGKLAPLLDGGNADQDSDAMSFAAIIKEFEKVTWEELDFRIEAANTKFFKDQILANGPTTCPTVIDELTTERIFTMTFVEGCSVSKKEKLIEQGTDPMQVGRDILESYLQQVFDAGIFHADPHQGNIMCSGGKVHWIDFGMVGEITEADINALEKIVVGLLKSDTDGMADGVLAIGSSGAGCDRNKLKDDLELFSAKYMSVSSLSDIDFSALLGEVVDLADRHHITMPGRFTMLVRSFLTIEGVMEQLCPELDLFEIISDKLMDRMKKSFSLEREIMNLGSGVLDMGKKVSRIPQLLADTLSDIMKGRLKINMELTGYEELMVALGEKINDIILVIIGCVLFSGGTRLAATQIYPILPNGMPLFAVIVLLIGATLLIYAVKRIFKKKK